MIINKQSLICEVSFWLPFSLFLYVQTTYWYTVDFIVWTCTQTKPKLHFHLCSWNVSIQGLLIKNDFQAKKKKIWKCLDINLLEKLFVINIINLTGRQMNLSMVNHINLKHFGLTAVRTLADELSMKNDPKLWRHTLECLTFATVSTKSGRTCTWDKTGHADTNGTLARSTV